MPREFPVSIGPARVLWITGLQKLRRARAIAPLER
jgi:hypothetical protein